MSRFIFIILWLLIQAAIVEGTLQMAAANTDVIWSEWSRCKIDNVCPHGRRERRRLCDASDLRCVNTNLIQNAKCLVRNCRRETSFESDEKDFTNWSAFTICSATCGKGIQKRTRKCTRSYCTGRTIEQQTCKLADCPVYSSWFVSTPCSKTCGFGIQERTRICLSDSPLCSNKETKMITICKMEKCNNALVLSPSRLNDLRIDRVQKDEDELLSNALILSPSRLNDLRIDRVQKDEDELLSRINDRKIKRVKDLYERKKILAITGGTKAPEQSYSIQHSYEENNGIKFLLKPFQYKEHYSLKTLVDASNDHVTTGLTYLVCAILLQIFLHVLTYLYIYRKGCCIKKVHESFGKNRRRRTFKDTAKFILGQAATEWILRKTKTILKRQPVSNRRNIDNMFNRQQGEYDEEGYLLGRPLRELLNEDVEINMDHFDSSSLESSFDAFYTNIKENLDGCIISPHTDTEPQSEQNITSRTSIIDNTESHLCEHVKTVSLIDFGNKNIDRCLIRQSSDPLYDSLDLDDDNSLDKHGGKYHSYKEPVHHDSGFILNDINFDVESAQKPYNDKAEHLAHVSSSPEKHKGQSSRNEWDINEMVLPPPTIITSVGPPPNITAPYSDPGCDKMSESIPYSGTPASKGKYMNNCNNAGRNDDNPPQESPNFGGDVKKEIKSDLSANFTSPILTEPARKETRNNFHPQTNDTLRDENFVEKTVDHKGATEPKFTVKSPESQSKNNLKIEHIDTSLKQTDSSKSTRCLQTPTKRSRFSFFRRKNRSAECLETKPSRETKKKKSRSFFSFFRKKKSSNQKSVNHETVSRPANNYFVTFKKYTKDFQLDPSPCKDADQCVTEVASCQNLRSVSCERLKWESRTRTASLNDLGSDVIKESSRFL